MLVNIEAVKLAKYVLRHGMVRFDHITWQSWVELFGQAIVLLVLLPAQLHLVVLLLGLLADGFESLVCL